MEDNKNGKSWSIGTFVRVLPNVRKAKTLVEYAHEEVQTNNGKSRGILQIKIPEDADPGLSHNTTGILEYEFDKVFDEDTSQSTVFDSIAKEKIHDVFEGINSTIFAYGQTGSGKTFTIFGGESFADRGLIPRSIAYLFKERRAKELNNFSVKCLVSFTEVYKETVYDLLLKQKKNLPIEQWTPVQVLEGENGLTLRNLNVFEVESEDDALSLFFLGNSNRITSATVMNDASSRSHAIFTMIIESKGIKDGKTIFASGKMNFVDLAGSERIYKITSPDAKETIEEAKSINLSLHYLEQVIVSLRDQSKNSHSNNNGNKIKNHHNNIHGHVPYRNCILTSILRDSLGGNCRSGFILTLAMDRKQFEESVSTCRFGQRCGEAKVTVHANAEVSLVDQIKELNLHIKQLEKQIHVLEDEKSAVNLELQTSKDYWKAVWEPRALTSVEKVNCKLCVQNLFASAKESLSLSLSNSNQSDDGPSPPKNQILNTNKNQRIIDSNEKLPKNHDNVDNNDLAIPITPATISVSSEVDSLIERSQEDLYLAVEKMDRAVLIELSIALGGLMQTMFLEREKAKAEEQKRIQRKTRIMADKESRLKARMELEAAEKVKILAAEKEAAIKAQKDADDIEIMLSQVDSGILKPSPKTSVMHSRKNSVKSIPDITLDSPRVSVGNLTPRERTDYGLSMESISMLVTGSNFNVPNFLGLKTPKFFYITTDISNIVYGSSNGNHQTVIPFSKFESAEVTKNVILLKGKASVKSIHLEYFSSSTSEENKSMASDWCNALNVCIDRANGRRNSILEGGSGSGSSPNNLSPKNTIKIIQETFPKKST